MNLKYLEYSVLLCRNEQEHQTEPSLFFYTDPQTYFPSKLSYYIMKQWLL